MFSCRSFATTTDLNPSINLLSESKNILALPTRALSETDAPGLVFVGDRQQQIPVRLVIFAEGGGGNSVGNQALLKLLVDLALAPLLAHDYALFCYLSLPQTAKTQDFPGWNFRLGKTPAPEELQAFDADGFISIRANDSVGGLQIEASDRTIANEVAWPAVVRASKIQQLDGEPVRCVQTEEWGWPDSISNPPSNAFRLVIRTPWVAETENQIAAIGIALKEILLQYRSLRNFAKAL
jgi:hypothetical protein